MRCAYKCAPKTDAPQRRTCMAWKDRIGKKKTKIKRGTVQNDRRTHCFERASSGIPPTMIRKSRSLLLRAGLGHTSSGHSSLPPRGASSPRRRHQQRPHNVASSSLGADANGHHRPARGVLPPARAAPNGWRRAGAGGQPSQQSPRNCSAAMGNGVGRGRDGGLAEGPQEKIQLLRHSCLVARCGFCCHHCNCRHHRRNGGRWRRVRRLKRQKSARDSGRGRVGAIDTTTTTTTGRRLELAAVGIRRLDGEFLAQLHSCCCRNFRRRRMYCCYGVLASLFSPSSSINV